MCQICGKIGHHALKCWHRFDKGYQDDELPQAMTAMRIMDVTDSGGHEWYPDTGVSAHVTSSTANLQFDRNPLLLLLKQRKLQAND